MPHYFCLKGICIEADFQLIYNFQGNIWFLQQLVYLNWRTGDAWKLFENATTAYSITLRYLTVSITYLSKEESFAAVFNQLIT